MARSVTPQRKAINTIAAWAVGVEMASTAAGQRAVAVAGPVPPTAPILRPDAPQISA